MTGTNEDPATAKSNSGSTAGFLSPQARNSTEKTTAESIGTIRSGQPCGDSGYGLEEVLLGGRLRHRHIKGRDFFQVKTDVTVAVMREATPDILQVETLILVVDETLPSQRELWLSDDYVERLLGNLQSG